MSLQDLINVQINLQTATVSQAGFGTPLFIGNGAFFSERVRTYTSLTGVAADIPTTAEEYVAAQALFSQTPSVSQIMIGRRDSTATVTPTNTTTGAVVTLDIEVNDGDSVSTSYTVQALDTEEEIVDGLLADITAATDVDAHITATKVGTGAATTLTIVAATASDFYILSNEANVSLSFASTETAADVMSAIQAENDDFYFVTAHDHTEAFVLALAADVEAKSKIYFTSNQDTGALAALANPATDTIGKLTDLGYDRTAVLFHDTADTTFPECRYVGKFAPFNPGTVSWTWEIISGLSASKDPATGQRLSATQEGYLADRHANYVKSLGTSVGAIVYEGEVVGNEYIDLIRSRDFLVARIEEDLAQFLLNAQKVPHTPAGRDRAKNRVEGVLSRYVSTVAAPNILRENDPFIVSVVNPSATDITNRKMDLTFTAYLAGAINEIAITGTLTFE